VSRGGLWPAPARFGDDEKGKIRNGDLDARLPMRCGEM
jgi:hypothetical protein